MPAQSAYTLNEQSVAAIRNLIEARFSTDHLREEFPNPLLREDALSLLDHYCTVIYYPL